MANLGETLGVEETPDGDLAGQHLPAHGAEAAFQHRVFDVVEAHQFGRGSGKPRGFSNMHVGP
ncbi:MAG: hypothetical protein IT564_08245 [Rhodospirillales bacterium]|nr:hypothetical protein [Rhodospirillales bacterium]